MSSLKDVIIWVVWSIFFIGVLSSPPNTVFVNERIVGDLHYYEFSETNRYSKDDIQNPQIEEEPHETGSIYQKTNYNAKHYSENSKIDVIFLVLTVFSIMLIGISFKLCERLIGTCRTFFAHIMPESEHNDGDHGEHSKKITHGVTLWEL
jgi:hypothetical protein